MSKSDRRNMSLEELDRQIFFHPNTDLRAFAAGELGDPQIVESGKGMPACDCAMAASSSMPAPVCSA